MNRGEGPVSMPHRLTSNPLIEQVGGSHRTDDAVVNKER